MLLRFDQVQQRTDEETLLYRVKDAAEDAINHIGPTPFTPPRIQPNDLRAYYENAPNALMRRWLVTITHGDRFLVRVTLDLTLQQWQSEVIQWESSHKVGGIYYVKVAPQREAPILDNIYNNNISHQGPIGYARLVGYTQEEMPRAVYWLYEGDSAAARAPLQVQRGTSGDYLLIERRFIPVAPSVPWDVLKQ